LRSRIFLYSTLALLVLVGASAVFASALTQQKSYRVAVAAPAPPGLTVALQRAIVPFDAKAHLTVVASAAAGRDELAAKRVDRLVLLRDDQLVFRTNVDSKLERPRTPQCARSASTCRPPRRRRTALGARARAHPRLDLRACPLRRALV
jgi:hypothetical protein